MRGPSAGERPAPFSRYTTPEFWGHSHISALMLEHHLDPLSDRASRRQDTIDRPVDWVRRVLGLTPGSRLLDLGCRPGLYAVPSARGGGQALRWTTTRRS